MSVSAVDLLENVTEIANVTHCVKCQVAEGIRSLSCGHLICPPCSVDAARCPTCGAPFEPHRDPHLDQVLEAIRSLSEAVALQGNLDNPCLHVYFAPERAINKHDCKGETRLHKLARAGDLDKIEALLRTGIDPNEQDFASWTALHEAVTAGKTEAAKLLLKYGAFVSVPGLNYATPLHSAVENNDVAAAKLLIEYGAELGCFNKDGKSPLDLCATEEMKTALCVTPRRPHIHKVYTIPIPKVFCMDVDEESVDRLKQKYTTVSEKGFLAGEASYVVLGMKKLDGKLLQAAMLQGLCIVNTNWLHTVLTTEEPINPFEYIPIVAGYCLHRSVLNRFNKLPRLFDGLHFYFLHATTQKIGGHDYTAEDLKLLVQLGGGKVTTRRPGPLRDGDARFAYHARRAATPVATHYVIYDATQGPPPDGNTAGVKVKPAKWFVMCINNFCLRD